METQLTTNDHDILIELRTQMAGVRSDIKDIKEDTSRRVALLEDHKADRTEIASLKLSGDKIHDDHERRIRRIEWVVGLATGAFFLIEIGLRLLPTFFK